ncbi:MAG: FAD:protein FMN transferase [Microthrixaceae bacterium]|nr:FAD:protein FMN transferase [Microthrixaceae bacterium]
MASAVVVQTHDAPPDAGRVAQHRLVELEALWSRFAEGSDLDRLNRAGGEPVTVSRATITLLRTMAEGAEVSEHRYDPTILPALLDAGYRASVDDPERVTELPPGHHRSGVGLADMEVDNEHRTATLPAGVAIDPGGIGKGLAADLVAELLVSKGAAGALVSIGGDVAMAGEAPRPAGWVIEVEDPHEPSRAVARMAVRAGGVATSSTLSRRWQGRSGSTHHVIDPTTGAPSTTDLATVTVVASRAWLAEVHATGALLGGSGDVSAYADRHRLNLLAIDHAGRRVVTDGLMPTLLREELVQR